MRIRDVFILILLVATIVPPSIFGFWAYRDGIKSEFEDVSDRHLLLANSLGNALGRYRQDIDALSSSVSAALIKWKSYPDINETLSVLDIDYIAVVDRKSGEIVSKVVRDGINVKQVPSFLTDKTNKDFKSNSSNKIQFSPVMDSPDQNGHNVMYGYHNFGEFIAVTRINTNYFLKLGKSISFGVKGHAAIVDHQGNVLSHPLDSWATQRKNIAGVSAVKRMMAGETGVQQFYSPALKGDMIAGFTSVPHSKWGVMIPQPIDELYARVWDNNKALMFVMLLAAAITVISLLIILRIIGRPIIAFTSMLRSNAESGHLKPIDLSVDYFLLHEFKDVQKAYNQLFAQVENANKEIHELAYTDSVTDLPNRAKFQKQVEATLNDEALLELGGSFIFLDIDNFKMVNDIHGHEIGDLLLKSIAKKLSERVVSKLALQLRDNSTIHVKPCVSRIGGDEFAIFVPGLVGKKSNSSFLDRLVRDISELNNEILIDVNCSASIGSAEYPANGGHMSGLMRSADIAMYQAKKNGKNQYQQYSSTLGEITENEICSDFARAIDQDELVLEYQPKICTRRQVVAGAEALIRWNHPKLGRLSPSLWMPAIANKSLMKDLGDWVISKSMHDLRCWINDGRELKLAVNVSPIQLRDRDIVDTLIACSTKYNIKPEMFELEVTEDTLFEESCKAEEVLREVSSLGFKISIDDYGIGYSNLSRLTGLPIDFIKIDKSLITDAINCKKVESVLESTIDLAKKLDCFVVAEGIETFQLAEFATAKGANLLQGFLFSKSLPSDEFLNWIDNEGEIQVKGYASTVNKKGCLSIGY